MEAPDPDPRARPRRRTRVAVLGVAVLVLAALAVNRVVFRSPMRPTGETGYVYGTVVATGDASHPGRVRLDDGEVVEAQVEPPPGAGLSSPPGLLPAYRVGDRVQVAYQPGPGGRRTYAVADWQRGPVLVWLLAGFVAVVALVAGGKGLRALVGTAAGLAIVLLFLVPAILAGGNPVLVALVGSGGILALSMYFVHGVNWKTTAALAGTVATVALALGIGDLLLRAGHLASFGDEESTYIAALDGAVRLRGLVLAAVVVGALGALADVTVGQAATVAELAHVGPELGVAELYRRAMNVGLDHIGSLVNTLVLAYLSTALPLVLLLRMGGGGWQETLNREAVAVEVVHTLVGSITLVLAVPLTTMVAAVLFRGDRHRDRRGPHPHGHQHGHA
jgi:uncharacterized membrane protein